MQNTSLAGKGKRIRCKPSNINAHKNIFLGCKVNLIKIQYGPLAIDYIFKGLNLFDAELKQ
jgi:hypothetical protein